MSMRAIVSVAAVLLLAGPALAQGPIATAGGSASTAPEPAPPPPPLPTAGAPPPPGPPVAMGPCGPEKVKPDGRLETAPHGELEAGVGTGGYRHVAGLVCQPIGQDGAAAVGGSYTQANPTYRRR